MKNLSRADPLSKPLGRPTRPLGCLLLSVAAALIFKQFLFSVYAIPSSSMEDTLHPGDYVLVTRFSYNIRTFEHIPFTRLSMPCVSFPGAQRMHRGDVVVFNYPTGDGDVSLHSTTFIKRCVGLAGDTIKFSLMDRTTEKLTGSVIFVAPPPRLVDDRSQLVPEKHYFMVGDNRSISIDSRHWGPVPESHIIGRAVLILWSWSPDKEQTKFFITVHTTTRIWSAQGERIELIEVSRGDKLLGLALRITQL